MATSECPPGGDYTVSDIVAAFQTYAEHLDFKALEAEELNAVEHLYDFWTKQNVCNYEEILGIDKCYDIKDQHTILNSKHSQESTIDIDLIWRDYIEKAMKHRLELTTKRYLQLLSRG